MKKQSLWCVVGAAKLGILKDSLQTTIFPAPGAFCSGHRIMCKKCLSKCADAHLHDNMEARLYRRVPFLRRNCRNEQNEIRKMVIYVEYYLDRLTNRLTCTILVSVKESAFLKVF